MAVKLTKRKGFNFFRSYFDVYNELENPEDKLAFIDALLERQFMGIKPTNLKGMAKFAYISQTNSIDSQVKGYEDKTGIKLGDKNTPCLPPYVGGVNTPAEQVEEKEKVKQQVVYTVEDFLENWNEARTHFTGTQSHLNKLHLEESEDFKIALNDFNKSDIQSAIKGLFMQEYVPQDVMQFKPKHFLKNIDTYLDAFNNKKKNLYKK